MVSAFGFFLQLGVISAMECLNRMTFQQQYNRCHRPADALPRCRNKLATLYTSACLAYPTICSGCEAPPSRSSGPGTYLLAMLVHLSSKFSTVVRAPTFISR